MSNNRIILKNSILLNIKFLVTSFSGLIVTRILFKFFGVSDYGIVSVVSSLVIIIGLINASMVTTTFRFLSLANASSDEFRINKVFNISFTIHLVIGVLIIFLSEKFGVWYVINNLNLPPQRVPDALFLFRVLVYTSAISLVSVPYQGVLYSNENFFIISMIEIVKSLSLLILYSSMRFFTLNKIVNYSIVNAIVTLVVAGLYIIYCIKYNKTSVRLKFQNKLSEYKEMFFFSTWVLLGATAQTAKDTGSQLVLNKFFGTVVNSSFGIAASISIFVRILSNNIVQAATPQIISSSSSVNSQRGLQLVTYLSKYSFFLLFITTLPFLLETELVIKYWLGDVPIYAVVFCKLMLFIGLIDSLSSSFSAFISSSEKIKWFQITTSSVLIFGLLFSYLLFKMGYPPQYISLIYIGTSIFNLFIVLLLMKKLLKFNIHFLFKVSYSRVIKVLATTSPIFILIPKIAIIEFRFIYVAIISGIWSISSIYFFGLESNERKSISNFVIHFFKR